MNQRGLNLIQLAIVLVVIAVISSIVTFSWPQLTIEVRNQSQQLTSDLRYAQHLAQVRHVRTRINFSSGQYSMTELNGSTAINFPASGGNIITMPTNVTISDSGLPNDYVVFGEKGAPYTTNTTPGTALASTATITLTGPNSSHAVTIAPETGAISNPN
jgi:Tfp pilus assembly protein PilE